MCVCVCVCVRGGGASDGSWVKERCPNSQLEESEPDSAGWINGGLRWGKD